MNQGYMTRTRELVRSATSLRSVPFWKRHSERHRASHLDILSIVVTKQPPHLPAPTSSHHAGSEPHALQVLLHLNRTSTRAPPVMPSSAARPVLSPSLRCASAFVSAATPHGSAIPCCEICSRRIGEW